METTLFECPRCLFTEPLRREMRYCPRCGFADAKEAWLDRSPVDLPVGKQSYRILDRVAVGSLCNVYRCRIGDGSSRREGVFKVARDACGNPWIANEAQALRRLSACSAAARLMPFIPRLHETIGTGGGAEGGARQGNLLFADPDILALEELYTLNEVRSHFPAGLDGRNVAWVWRRLLTVLGYVHECDVLHRAVLPMHVLIEPKGHKLLLVDWCCAVIDASRNTECLPVVMAGYAGWYKREGATRSPASTGLDIGLAARTMVHVLVGDPENANCPPGTEPALARYFQRCIGMEAPKRPSAWELLHDFDRLLEALWGPRKFQVLELPPKQRV